MKLSENLVKQFVKATKDNAPKKTDHYMYGTVQMKGNRIEVLFDGAKDPTPCTSAVTVEDGDRVIVMIKNRQAVITSNVSKPTINADYLEAGEAKISGTIHAARYEDSTGNFTMDIGGKREGEDGPMSPTFSIGGYIDGDPANKYVRLDIYLTPGDEYEAIPSLWIEGSVRSKKEDVDDEQHVNMGITPHAIQFTAAYFKNDQLTRQTASIPWGFHA